LISVSRFDGARGRTEGSYALRVGTRR
jgi:hypothetical protein